ncbi:MAG: relaxase/mobilization nuclease domain-containing protein [Polyangiaceae bacterium]|jgi:hypothetical protein
MIISGGSRSQWRKFAAHLMKTEGGTQRVAVEEIRGLAADNLVDAFREIEALGQGTRATNFYYHANIDPRAHEHMTPEQWEKAIDLLEKNLGLEGHSRFVVEHEKNGRTHRHVVWSRVDTDRMRVVPDEWDYAIHQRTATALEKEFGHEKTRRRREPDQSKGPENWEYFRGHETKIPVKQVEAELSALWRQADTAPAFAAALDERGYILCEGNRGLCVVDQAGKEHSLYRRVGLRKAEVDARMEAIHREALPSVEEARKLARERAAQRGKDAPDAPLPDFAPDPEPDTKGPGGAQRELPAPERSESEHGTRQRPERTPEAAPAPSQTSRLFAFERVVAQWKEAYRAAIGDGSFIAEGIDWLARKVGARQAEPPAAGRALTAFEQVAEDTKRAFAENGGEPPTIGTVSFWQRAALMLQEVGGHAVTWVKNLKDQVTGFASRLLHDRNTAREHEPDIER